MIFEFLVLKMLKLSADRTYIGIAPPLLDVWTTIYKCLREKNNNRKTLKNMVQDEIISS